MDIYSMWTRVKDLPKRFKLALLLFLLEIKLCKQTMCAKDDVKQKGQSKKTQKNSKVEFSENLQPGKSSGFLRICLHVSKSPKCRGKTRFLGNTHRRGNMMSVAAIIEQKKFTFVYLGEFKFFKEIHYFPKIKNHREHDQE